MVRCGRYTRVSLGSAVAAHIPRACLQQRAIERVPARELEPRALKQGSAVDHPVVRVRQDARDVRLHLLGGQPIFGIGILHVEALCEQNGLRARYAVSRFSLWGGGVAVGVFVEIARLIDWMQIVLAVDIFEANLLE